MDIVQRLATYQIVRGSVSTKNDNSFITRRNSYNIIVSHLYAYALLVNRAMLRAHETASDEGSGIGRYNAGRGDQGSIGVSRSIRDRRRAWSMGGYKDRHREREKLVLARARDTPNVSLT